MNIEYKVNKNVISSEFIELLKSSRLGAKYL